MNAMVREAFAQIRAAHRSIVVLNGAFGAILPVAEIAQQCPPPQAAAPEAPPDAKGTTRQVRERLESVSQKLHTLALRAGCQPGAGEAHATP